MNDSRVKIPKQMAIKDMVMANFASGTQPQNPRVANMKQIPQDSTTRLWCLSGLTGIVLMAGLLLGEGQARPYTPSPVMPSIQVNKLNLQTHSSESVNPEKSLTLKSIGEKKAGDPAHHHQVAAKNPAKKRVGLAMLFLGILAEKS